MAKPTSQYVCQSCGAVAARWSGKCGACGTWDTLVEEQLAASIPKGLGATKKGRKIELEALDGVQATPARSETGIGELNRVLGGGLVAGSAVLLGGDPGIGKSTLLLQMAGQMAAQGRKIVYISGEESVGQIQLRAGRLGIREKGISLAAANSVRDILSSLEAAEMPDVIIIDSIQTMFVDTLDSAPGTVAQVRTCAQELIRFAKQREAALILVGHVTKDGQIAGPRVLEHMVDAVLYFEGERGQLYRILRTVKNRFGATDEIGVFEMTGDGIAEVANPSLLFLPERDSPISGSAIFAGIEGTRPVLVEIQALVLPTMMATPRRAVVGWDSARLAMLLAVLEARAGLRFSDKEVYVNVAGGLRINEPAADLSVALALASAAFNRPLPAGAVTFGEIGLSGEIRPVSAADLRLKEAEKLGFKRAAIPAFADKRKKGKEKPGDFGLGILALHHVEDIQNLFDAHASFAGEAA